jgi:hypothetical protein
MISCSFCNKNTIYISIPEMEAYNASVYFCNSCVAEYITLSNKQIAHTSLYTIINSKTYRFSISKSLKSNIAYVEFPGKHTSTSPPTATLNKGIKYIIFFDITNKPDITPSNIQNKLQTILNFI